MKERWGISLLAGEGGGLSDVWDLADGTSLDATQSDSSAATRRQHSENIATLNETFFLVLTTPSVTLSDLDWYTRRH